MGDLGRPRMLTLRRASERHHQAGGGVEVWSTFKSSGTDLDGLEEGFGALEGFSEGQLSPGSQPWPHDDHEAEVITYVAEGAVVYSDSEGRSGVMQAGEFGYATIVKGVRYSETNASHSHLALVFRIQLRPPSVEIDLIRERKRFSAAERRSHLRAIAATDGRAGSLRVRQEAIVYSGLLETGQHVVHELGSGRMAWLHVVRGEGALADLILGEGDGVGLADARALAFTARESTEVLVVDVEEPPQVDWNTDQLARR